MSWPRSGRNSALTLPVTAHQEPLAFLPLAVRFSGVLTKYQWRIYVYVVTVLVENSDEYIGSAIIAAHVGQVHCS